MPSDEATATPVASGPVLLAALLLTSCLCAGAVVVVPVSCGVAHYLRAEPEPVLALKITFFDGVNSARYEVHDPADFDGATLAEVHRRFYGPAVRANANTEKR